MSVLHDIGCEDERENRCFFSLWDSEGSIDFFCSQERVEAKCFHPIFNMCCQSENYILTVGESWPGRMIEILQPGFVEVQGQKERTDVSYSLGRLDSGEPHEQGHDQDQRQKAHALSGGGQNSGGHGIADGLKEHVVEDQPAGQRQSHALSPQGKGTDADNVRIVPPENGYQKR